ncbi:cupin domain-containing protein [Lipomyces orientalis]|uniref:Cupin domain-containing protein n=1 Tax=Lipomyces orientalis TaxID=1233043 RepID=A0ACC3TJI8_9ASCO
MQSGKPLVAKETPAEVGSPYPEPFASLATSTAFRRLGDQFGLTQFGVNLITLDPGAQSGLRHWHSLEDEFIYILAGEPILVTNNGECKLSTGMCIGFKAQDRNAHLMINRSDAVVHYLVIGSRVPGDVSYYPDDDLSWFPTERGEIAVHKDGTPYP